MLAVALAFGWSVAIAALVTLAHLHITQTHAREAGFRVSTDRSDGSPARVLAAPACEPLDHVTKV